MTNKDRTLELLKDQEWVYTGDFLRAGCGSRFGARIAELRDEGHEILCEAVRPGEYRYKLTTGNAVLCWVCDLTKPPGERISQEYRNVGTAA